MRRKSFEWWISLGNDGTAICEPMPPTPIRRHTHAFLTDETWRSRDIVANSGTCVLHHRLKRLRNAAYVLHEKLAQSQASLLHLKNGRRLRQEGRLEEATGEFQKAAAIDPSNQAAATELSQVLAKQAEAKRAKQTAIQRALKSREESSVPCSTIIAHETPSNFY